MRKRRGYTLAELFVVILIVTVLASIMLSLMRSRADSAKWTEGKSRAGLIATAIRAWNAGYDMPGSWTNAQGSLDAATLGFGSNDLKGKYFDEDNFTWNVHYDGQTLSYVIIVTKPDMSWKPDEMILDNGQWTEGSGL